MKFVKWAVTAAVLVMSLLAAIAPAAAAADRPIGIYLDNRKLASDVDPFIIPKVNLTMVPLRVISEGIGASVFWSQQTKTVTTENADTTISLTAGASAGTVGGVSIPLAASVQNVRGRIMVPLRFVGEQLGLQVDWNGTARTIALTSNGGGIPPASGAGTGSAGGASGSPGSGDGSGGSLPGAGDGSGSLPGSAGGGASPGSDLPDGTSVPPGAGDNGGTLPGSGTVPAAGGSLRGAWVSTVFNLDWPSAPSYGNPQRQEQEFDSLLDDLQGMGLNAVFVQVRSVGDALYPSSLVPWSKFLTGTQGKDPGYDPLAFMIAETHKRGMQFHAWFNPFRANTDTSTDKLAPNQVAKLHPDWIVASGGALYINPGIPAARQQIIDAIMEVVARYDIDGVHLDDYFYPTNGTFGDDAAYQTYNAGRFSNKGDWRRDNINQFVQKLGESIHSLKPAVKFGISPFGVWRNKSADPTGSDTKAGVTSYDDMYADVRTWIRSGWIDYVMPQIYWSLSFGAARYDTLVDWWANEVKGTGVSLYIGHSPYKLGTAEAGWQDAHEIINQLAYNKLHPEVAGDVFYSAKDLRKNPLGVADLLRAYYGG
ncbi:family 10 glycosylhydrolase [Paenibacillus humicola]|uniref:family 10 glycosylhydrolase n=1 Tax=Paenibacillus humicola TaxID=3110540 RepID=UPI00237B1E01|nr:family 10 glycosylhydrolase [Paenibacillus humicola]